VLDALDAPAGPVRPTLRAYRPGRRAVVELQVDRLRLFVKVVPPSTVQALQTTHKRLEGVVPVPRSHGWSPELGLVVQEAIPGETLRVALETEVANLPDVQVLATLLDLLPASEGACRVADPLTLVRGHSRLLRRLLPDQAEVLVSLEEQLVPDAAGEPEVPVHGDFYEGQVMVRNGHLAGLLDLDTVGVGSRTYDWATMIGHLSVRAEDATAAVRPRIRDYGKQVLALAETETDRERLRKRVAAVVLGLATGPFRVQTPNWPLDTRRRITLAQRWVSSAEDKREFIAGSVPPHGSV
jgi:hypothetical protein